MRYSLALLIIVTGGCAHPCQTCLSFNPGPPPPPVVWAGDCAPCGNARGVAPAHPAPPESEPRELLPVPPSGARDAPPGAPKPARMATLKYYWMPGDGFPE